MKRPSTRRTSVTRAAEGGVVGGGGAIAGGGGAEAEDALGAHDGVGGGPAGEEGPVVVALELAGVGVEDVQGTVQHRGVEAVVNVRPRQGAPAAPHPPAH